MNRLRFLLSYIVQHKFSYLLGILFVILTNWIAVTIPVYLKRSIDILSSGITDVAENQSRLFDYLVIMFGLSLCIIFVRTLSRAFIFNPGRAIEYQIKNDLFQKLTYLRKPYYDQNPTGTIISKIQNDINGVRMICGFGIMQLFNIISALSFTPYKMWQLSPRLTLYTVLPIVLVFVIVRFSMHFVVRHTRERMVDLQQTSGFIVSILSGIDILKNYDLGDWSKKEFDRHNEKLKWHSIRISFFRSFLMPVLQNLENILKVIILLVGGTYVIQQQFTIGELTAYIAYLALLTMPIMGLGWLTTIFETGFVGIASLQTILNQPTQEENNPKLSAETRERMFDQGLTVKGLSYSYDGQSTPTLENISFEIKPNQTVGILGKIGSGKTTLVNCINRYLDIQPDQVFIGDTDMTRMNDADIRSIIHTVSQDVFLFSNSVEENIRFGSDESTVVTEEQLSRVVEESALTSEIDHFPKQLDTIVGEKGIMLSGGQKQRISLARAMMAPCDLLILDNILSAVDQETERFLLSHIHKRRTARSLLLVSHRVQALEEADMIMVLDQGKIIDRGTHQELVNRPGLYQETWHLQNRYHESD